MVSQVRRGLPGSLHILFISALIFLKELSLQILKFLLYFVCLVHSLKVVAAAVASTEILERPSSFSALLAGSNRFGWLQAAAIQNWDPVTGEKSGNFKRESALSSSSPTTFIVIFEPQWTSFWAIKLINHVNQTKSKIFDGWKTTFDRFELDLNVNKRFFIVIFVGIDYWDLKSAVFVYYILGGKSSWKWNGHFFQNFGR